jgi:hypothetical protein
MPLCPLRQYSKMANYIIAELSLIQQKLRTNLTESEKEDWLCLFERRLDIYEFIHDPLYPLIDCWGRSPRQQKEDFANTCGCTNPEKNYTTNCCELCGFWVLETHEEYRRNIMNLYDDDDSCYSDEYWEPRTWQTCHGCGVYVCGLNDHKRTCMH